MLDDEITLPFIFVAHDADPPPELAAFKSAHPDWVSFPATFIPHQQPLQQDEVFRMQPASEQEWMPPRKKTPPPRPVRIDLSAALHAFQRAGAEHADPVMAMRALRDTPEGFEDRTDTRGLCAGLGRGKANLGVHLVSPPPMPAATGTTSAPTPVPLAMMPQGDLPETPPPSSVHLAQFLPFLEIPPVEELTPLEQLPPGAAAGPRSGMSFPRTLGKPDAPDQFPPCTYCGGETGPGNFHRDHIIPRSQGGNGSGDNLAPSCPSCNLSKGPRTPEQWYNWLRGGGI